MSDGHAKTREEIQKFEGAFYTPLPFARKALKYLEKVIATKWWTKGYRLWDMAAGTGSIVNISVPVPLPTTLTSPTKSTNGAFQFAFTNSVGALFGVLATTNLSLPQTNWTPLGGVAEIFPGQFLFTDPQATNSPQRFYRVRSP